MKITYPSAAIPPLDCHLTQNLLQVCKKSSDFSLKLLLTMLENEDANLHTKFVVQITSKYFQNNKNLKS